MKEEIKKLIEDQFKFLPKELQETIYNLDWLNITASVGRNFYLSEEEINDLQKEVGLVLAGLDFEELLSENIAYYVDIKVEEAKKIATELEQRIFKPLIDNLSIKIKTDLKDRPINWQQNLDFILSGGDYTAFIRKPIKEKDESSDIPQGNTSLNHSDLDDLKSKFTI